MGVVISPDRGYPMGNPAGVSHTSGKSCTSIPRRGFLKAFGVLSASTGIGCLTGYGYAMEIEPRWAQVVRIEVPLPLPEGFSSLRMICLSDFHFDPIEQGSYLETVVSKVNALDPDLVCLLGDYVFHDASAIDELATIFQDLYAREGIYAILGNHDLWTDGGRIRASLESVGVRVLVNESVVIRSGGAGIVLAGLDDGWSGSPDLEASISGSPSRVPVVIMMHEPDFAAEFSKDARVLLQLSGHTHGGQVRLPGIGAPFKPAYGELYGDGLARVGGMWLYTTRGVGLIPPRMRVNCRPEITLITLVREESHDPPGG
jgi:predicted MPP superfamily phosphohydrolase